MNLQLTLLEEPAEYAGVFQDLTYRYQQNGTSVSYSNQSGKVLITTSGLNVNQVEADTSQKLLIRAGSLTTIVDVTSYPSSTTILTDLDYTDVAPGATMVIGLLETILFTIEGGYSNSLLATTGDYFPDKPLKTLLQFELYPDPVNGEYSFSVSDVLQSYFSPKEYPVDGITSNLSLIYRVKRKEDLGPFPVTKASDIRFGYFGGVLDMEAYTPSGTVLHEYGAINFKDDSGDAVTTLFTTIETSLKALKVNQTAPVYKSSSLTPCLDLLTGACYVLEWRYASALGTVTIPDAPDWITVLDKEIGQDTNLIKIQFCPTFLPVGTSVLGDFAGAHFNATHYSETQSIKGLYELEIHNNAAKVADLCLNIIESAEVITVDCTSRQLNLGWMNPEGGFSSFIFTGYNDYGLNISGETTFEDNTKRHYKGEVIKPRRRVLVRSQVVSQLSAYLVKSLRQSIAVWLLNEETGKYDIPVMIDSESFTYDKDRYRATESLIQFGFTYSDELRLQTL